MGKGIFWFKNTKSWHHWCYKEKWKVSLTALRFYVKKQVLFFQEQPFMVWWVLLVFQGLWSKASYQSNLFNIWRSAYLIGQVAKSDYNCRNSTFEQGFYQITHIWKKAKKNNDWREWKSFLKNGMKRCGIIQKLCVHLPGDQNCHLNKALSPVRPGLAKQTIPLGIIWHFPYL